MSYTEYYDFFDRCQDTAPYHLFVFDLVDSKELYSLGDDTYLSKISLLIDTLSEDKIYSLFDQTKKN